MNIIKQITTFIQKHNLIPDHATIIIGLSGGPDSVFLTHVLNNLKQEKKLTLLAAHLNHEWRSNAHNDTALCKTLCQQLNIPLIHKKASDLAASFNYNGSKEELGRKLRRYFFEQLLQEYNANVIALGHHAQDQQETFFMRMIRGATLSGLTSMKPHDGFYIRPLLTVNKLDIMHYLNANTIPFCIDPTNQEEIYLRNKIRRQVLPTLEQCDQRFAHNFSRMLNNLQETEYYLNTLTQEQFKIIATASNGFLEINNTLLLKQSLFLQKRLIMHWLIQEKAPFTPTESFLDEILEFLQQPGSKEHRLHQAWSIIKQKNNVYIKKYPVSTHLT